MAPPQSEIPQVVIWFHSRKDFFRLHAAAKAPPRPQLAQRDFPEFSPDCGH
jgi:hypothetical protein